MSEQRIRELVHVGRAEVLQAKAWLIARDLGDSDCLQISSDFVRSQGYELGATVIIGGEAEGDALLKAARGISLQLAAIYAIWELVHSGHLLPRGSIQEKRPSIPYQSSHQSGGWRFHEFAFSYPARVFRPARSYVEGRFTNGDLYLQQLEIEDLHPGIEEALQEAARCFRHDLLTGTVAMLGAAVEGAWTELATVIVAAFDTRRKPVGRLKETVDNPREGIGKLLKALNTLSEGGTLADVLDGAGVSLEEVRQAIEWTDILRDARNVIHWSHEPHMANDHEKVSLLMLNAAPHLRTIWRIRGATTEFGG